MRKVPPSEVLREEINHSLAGGVEEGTELLSHLAHLGLGYLVQQFETVQKVPDSLMVWSREPQKRDS